jgi:hypothetical protein
LFPWRSEGRGYVRQTQLDGQAPGNSFRVDQSPLDQLLAETAAAFPLSAQGGVHGVGGNGGVLDQKAPQDLRFGSHTGR